MFGNRIQVIGDRNLNGPGEETDPLLLFISKQSVHDVLRCIVEGVLDFLGVAYLRLDCGKVLGVR